jgi:glycine dehydrogenase
MALTDNPTDQPDKFVRRHIGPNAAETGEMLSLLAFKNLDELVAAAVPQKIRLNDKLNLPAAKSEFEALAEIRRIASENKVFRSFIGQGYYDTITPPVIQRNVLENPGWYTQYTPYQAEISQGRLEALLNFQTMVSELTALDIANASMLDEATAAAEAMTMSHRLKDGRNLFFISETCHPQTIEVVRSRAEALKIEVVIGSHETFSFSEKVFGALVQYPDTFGAIHDYTGFAEKAHAAGAILTVATDLLALTLIKPPGEFGADIAIGSAQRFGVPLGYGGPHAAFFATRDEFKRQMPGRIVGVSKDSRGKPALRLALGTREQHIRREKATSNICTAQALLANMASLYACYHGAEGLKKIAKRVHVIADNFAASVMTKGFTVDYAEFFDTIGVECESTKQRDEILQRATERSINLRPHGANLILVSFDETSSAAIMSELISIFTGKAAEPVTFEKSLEEMNLGFRDQFKRTSKFLQHAVFNRYHSETEMLRYIKRLESRDLSLTASMIPLGSCTMKLNAAAEMFPVSWPEFAKIHPFAPIKQTRGYQILFQNLEDWLSEITGFAGISLQPNAGSQGEYAGLLVIRAYHESRGEPHRNVCLIPTSAHGTNPASAVMAGMKVVAVAYEMSPTCARRRRRTRPISRA